MKNRNKTKVSKRKREEIRRFRGPRTKTRENTTFSSTAPPFLRKNYEKTRVERTVTSDRAVRELRNWMTLGMKSWQVMGEVSCQVAHPFCVSAGRGCAFDACFCVVLRGSGGAVDENVVFPRVFVRAPYGFACFFRCFCISKSAEAFPHVLPRFGTTPTL